MTIKIEFYSVLRDLAGRSELELELSDGTTVETLLQEVYLRHPGLAPWNDRLLLAAGLDYVERTHVIQAGEIISVMPPVQGG